ncbi:MAG: hypothetical protein AAGE52_09185 [Myxococcota bacterium]
MMRALLLAVLVSSCGGDAGFDWQIRFADAERGRFAVAVDTSIIPGGCGSSSAAVYEEVVTRDGALVRPPILEPGVYGFRGRARDLNCAAFAEGCTEIILEEDSPATVVTELSDVTPTALCDASRCSDGDCR